MDSSLLSLLSLYFVGQYLYEVKGWRLGSIAFLCHAPPHSTLYEVVSWEVAVKIIVLSSDIKWKIFEYLQATKLLSPDKTIFLYKTKKDLNNNILTTLNSTTMASGHQKTIKHCIVLYLFNFLTKNSSIHYQNDFLIFFNEHIWYTQKTAECASFKL